MAYGDFTLASVVQQFSLTLDSNSDLYRNITDAVLDPVFLKRLEEDSKLALNVSTEKARSEFLIAPILAEVRRMTGFRIGIFSGVEFAVAPSQGLTGVCDYIITRSPEQLLLSAPVVMLVEAKNEDMRRGYAQCIAEMLAAQAFNTAAGQELNKVYGAVTIGDKWRFLELENTTVRVDAADYYLEDLTKIIGILLHLIQSEDTKKDTQ
jgi:hypothetical protein